MTRGVLCLPDGKRLTVAIGPEPRSACHSYWVQVETDGGLRVLGGLRSTYREAWDAVLRAVEGSIAE